MKVVTALLCDKAHPREGLLYVIGGGITRIWRPEFPAPAGVELALMIELHKTETEKLHQLDIELVAEDGDKLAELHGAFQSGGKHLNAWETQLVPMAFNLSNVAITEPGPYSVEVSIDNNHQHSLRFVAEVRRDEKQLDLGHE